MRFRIRKAQIPADLRRTFEQFGARVLQQILSVGGSFRFQGQSQGLEAYRKELLAWLTEHYDKENRIRSSAKGANKNAGSVRNTGRTSENICRCNDGCEGFSTNSG